MELVVDSSLSLAWALPDEKSALAEKILDRLSGTDVLWVPPLWWYEIANALTFAERRKRISETEAALIIELYKKLPFRLDNGPSSDIAWRYIALARQFGLRAYDASYLELAQRRGIALASLDSRLTAAASKAGLPALQPKPRRTLH